jgi:hypothetical protein
MSSRKDFGITASVETGMKVMPPKATPLDMSSSSELALQLSDYKFIGRRWVFDVRECLIKTIRKLEYQKCLCNSTQELVEAKSDNITCTVFQIVMPFTSERPPPNFSEEYIASIFDREDRSHISFEK